jgi:hypothetical protein
VAHLWQAGRNERLARQLLSELGYKEWAVAVTFYSALHYVEAAFSGIANIRHSETSMPLGWKKSIHAWREDLIFQNFAGIRNEYRKLSNSSMIARYLSSGGTAIGQPVEDFFSDDDVGKFIDRDLDKIKREMGFAS